MKVVTYQLAYVTDMRADLCDACVKHNDHDCGVLGAIQHGLHRGTCDGARHTLALAECFAALDPWLR